MLFHIKKKWLLVFSLVSLFLLFIIVSVCYVMNLSKLEKLGENVYSYSIDSLGVQKFISQGIEDSTLGAPYKVYPINVRGFYATLVQYPFGSSMHKTIGDSLKIDSLTLQNPRGVILYVHGYNDYFFQKEMAEKFDSLGYAFFAIDLHGYGRSILKDKPRSDMFRITEHYGELDYAIAMCEQLGLQSGLKKNSPFILMGHSMGGLISSLYVNDRENIRLDALILNSPFIEMNYNLFMRKLVVPIIAFAGLLSPDFSLGSTGNPNYAYSLYKGNYGEWDYNTEWKPFSRPEVRLKWVRAIYRGQSRVRAGLNIKTPILVMHSDCSTTSEEWVDEYTHCDGVLDANLIQELAPKLGENVKVQKIDGALHDILLSKEPVRNAGYDSIFKFLGESVH